MKNKEIKRAIIPFYNKWGRSTHEELVYKIENTRANKKIINKLIEEYGYIIIYDGKNLNEGDFYIMTPAHLSIKEFYKIIKKLHPHGFGIFNLLEIGIAELGGY